MIIYKYLTPNYYLKVPVKGGVIPDSPFKLVVANVPLLRSICKVRLSKRM